MSVAKKSGLCVMMLLLMSSAAFGVHFNYQSFDSHGYSFAAPWTVSTHWGEFYAGTKFHASGGALPENGIALRADQGASTVELTLSKAVPNGTYDVYLSGYLSSNWWTLPQGVNLSVEGVDVQFIMPSMVTTPQTGLLGQFTVTDGQLDIVLKDTFFTTSPTANWVGFTGFDVESIDGPAETGTHFNYQALDANGYSFAEEWTVSPEWGEFPEGAQFNVSGGALPEDGIALRADQGASVVPLTLSAVVTNGTFEVYVSNCLSSDWWTQPKGINFTIEGVDVQFLLSDTVLDPSGPQSGFLGEFTVTDGELSIVVKDTFFTTIPTANWVGFTGFDIKRIDTPALDLDRGHRVLIEKGLQLQAQVFPTAGVDGGLGFTASRFAGSNFTTANFQWDTDCGLYLGSPSTAANWGRWAGSTFLQPNEVDYLDKLVSLQYSDEQDLSDVGRCSLVKGFGDYIHVLYPDVIVFADQYGSQRSVEDMRIYMDIAKPDMLMFNNYPFNGDVDGGSPTDFYGYLQKHRLLGLEGNDGSGEEPIPYGVYTQTFTVNGHDASESEMRLNQFSAWTFGYKFISAFTYNSVGTEIDSILFDGLGDGTPNAKFYQMADLNAESLNIGSALVKLVSTDVRMIMGEHLALIVTVANSTPADVTTGLSGADDYLTNASATNLGSKNNSKRGDIIIGFFKPLLESFDGEEYSDQVYFMVTNGLSDENGSASETQQQITLTFDMGASGITSLQRLSRDTGLVEVVPMVSDGGGIYHVDLVLDGGTGDLFKYNTGAPFIGAGSAPLPGDANLDGSVDVGDLGILAANYGTASGAAWSLGDFNGDGAVDVGDLGILAANYGTGSSSSDFDADYAKVFGDSADEEVAGDSLCGVLGLPLIAGLILMGLMLVRFEDRNWT